MKGRGSSGGGSLGQKKIKKGRIRGARPPAKKGGHGFGPMKVGSVQTSLGRKRRGKVDP